MVKSSAARPKQARNKKYMLVRYGRMGTLSWFEHNEAQIPRCPRRVVIKTERGLELGQLMGQLCPYRGGHFRFDQDEVNRYFEDSEIDYACDPAGKFVRYTTAEDLSEERHLQKIAMEEMEHCRELVREIELPMKIVDAEHVFGGERIIFYFMADGRVDFRELVKKLAHDYQTRIEMRQIGSRDEARLLADYETCGQECCCRRFLKALKPVNMRMAKMQKATLDPAKISGYCGRLKCCLRYEDKTYNELKGRLPKKNTIVKTKHGKGRVLDTQILTQLVMVEHEGGSKVVVPLEELEIISSGGGKSKEDASEHQDSKSKEDASEHQASKSKEDASERQDSKKQSEQPE